MSGAGGISDNAYELIAKTSNDVIVKKAHITKNNLVVLNSK